MMSGIKTQAAAVHDGDGMLELWQVLSVWAEDSGDDDQPGRKWEALREAVADALLRIGAPSEAVEQARGAGYGWELVGSIDVWAQREGHI